MAIKGFKEVKDNKGYRVDSKDREIFERELKESLFGTSATNWNVFGNTDMIEFVLYDTNDNQLPQGDDGSMVRYISMDNPEIGKYFLINEDIEDIKMNGAKEFLVDTEVLIREAGYSNGIFKTQITLVNRRMGSETPGYDKLWIHEISPSRTEIRILPLNFNDKGILPDLEERYNVFINDGEFRDDTISFVQQYVEELDLTKVFQQILRIKGKVKEGQGYVDLIKKEFKINDFGRFLLDVKTTLVKSIQYWVENKDSNVNSLMYGKSLNSIPPVSLGISEIKTKVIYTLTDIIDFILNKRDILEKSVLSQEEQVTFDEIEDILKTTTDDSEYDTTLPDNIIAPIRGCMDPNADNFNPDATINDGSCIYTPPPVDDVDVVDPPIEIPVRTKTYYWWEDDAWLSYKGVDGLWHKVDGNEYEFNEISFIEGPNIHGDIRTVQKVRISDIDDLVPIDPLDGICLDRQSINYRKPGPCRYFNPIDPRDDFKYDDGFTTYSDDRFNTDGTSYYDELSGNYVYNYDDNRGFDINSSTNTYYTNRNYNEY